ncbi:MAG: hypothetical protein CMO55_07855 [Verrucomicrobiales bacterium]|nr:hypothetical protein [Verrucomicrobiales bacterium]
MDPRDWIYLGSVFIALIAFGTGLVREVISAMSDQRNAQRKEIHEKLNKFYAPLLLQIEVLKQLNSSFKGGEDYRILEELLKGKYPEGNQKSILDQIIAIEVDVEKLILEGAGLVDKDLFSSMPEDLNGDKLLRRSCGDENYESVYQVLQDFLVHIRILRMAANKEICGDLEGFRKYVFPRILDEVLESKVLELKENLAELNRPMGEKIAERLTGS